MKQYSTKVQRSMRFEKSQSSRFGFSLIEMLIVLAVLGIILAFAVPQVLNSIRVSRLREAQTQLVKALEETRSAVRRYSYTHRIEFNLASRSYNIYAIDSNGAKVVASSPPEINGVLLNDIKILAIKSNISGSTSFDFNAPLGRFSRASPISIQIGYAADDYKTEVDVVGVTGLVVNRGIKKD
jgi:prepilin-type N-terminal cleavage/methylation domain-containing protein